MATRRRSPEPDPFTVLGLSPKADADAVRTARRRLAMELHPDHGGDAEQMQALNAAFERAMASLVTVPVHAAPPVVPPDSDQRDSGQPEPDSHVQAPTGRAGGHRQVERDEPSFVIEALPAEAFEALLVVSTWMGEVLVDEPPYLLEAHLHDPAECWCRLELLPEAGASTVMLTVAGIEGVAPPIEAVRDRWVANLNLLGRVEG